MSDALYQGHVAAPEGGGPLIFAFHGTGGDEHQFAGLAATLVPGAGVVAPRGDVPEQGGARFVRRVAEGGHDMEDLARRRDRMARYIDAMCETFGPRPLYGFGYSNGATLLASVVMARPDLFDRVALMHPLVTWELAPTPDLAGRKVLVTAGQHDPIAPWPQTQDLIGWLRAQDAETSTHVHDGGHELRQSEIAALGRHFTNGNGQAA